MVIEKACLHESYSICFITRYPNLYTNLSNDMFRGMKVFQWQFKTKQIELNIFNKEFRWSFANKQQSSLKTTISLFSFNELFNFDSYWWIRKRKRKVNELLLWKPFALVKRDEETVKSFVSKVKETFFKCRKICFMVKPRTLPWHLWFCEPLKKAFVKIEVYDEIIATLVNAAPCVINEPRYVTAWNRYAKPLKIVKTDAAVFQFENA